MIHFYHLIPSPSNCRIHYIFANNIQISSPTSLNTEFIQLSYMLYVYLYRSKVISALQWVNTEARSIINLKISFNDRTYTAFVKVINVILITRMISRLMWRAYSDEDVMPSSKERFHLRGYLVILWNFCSSAPYIDISKIIFETDIAKFAIRMD